MSVLLDIMQDLVTELKQGLNFRTNEPHKGPESVAVDFNRRISSLDVKDTSGTQEEGVDTEGICRKAFLDPLNSSANNSTATGTQGKTPGPMSQRDKKKQERLAIP